MWIRVMLAVVCACPLAAQNILGEFAGTVTDASDAAVSGAKVTATEVSTQRQWTAATNESGVYRIGSLPAGTVYQVTVEQAGFRISKVDAVRLDVGETRRLDFKLEVGAIAETVTVSAEGSDLSLERGEVSSVVASRSIVDLPLNGRNVYQLAELQPGVVRVAGTGLQESETTDARIGASGTRFRDNNILLDGVTNNNDRQGGRTTITLNPDAVEQFRVVTNNLSAEFGRSGGALISVLTKSGSNQPHGSAFWFLRNDNMDAATTFEARVNRKPEFRRNQFGGTLGGPIVRNHTFFFFSYQGLRQDRPSIVQYSVETPEFRDFVLRTRPNSVAARLLRDFPPLINPSFNIRDVGSPAPGVRVIGPADGIPDVGDAFIPVNGSMKDNQYSIRIDQTFNGGKDTITGRYSINDRKEVRPGDNSARAFTADFVERDQNVSLNYTHIFGPTVINELRLGWNYDPQITTGNFMEIPFVGFNVTGRSPSQFSQTFGNVFPLDFRLHTYQFYDALSLTRGNHGLKFGGDLRFFQENSDFPLNTRPFITFDDILDFADDEVLSIALRVDPGTGQPVGTYRNFRMREFGIFVQDDWKLTSRLTLNLGLRYDNGGTLKEKNDRLSTIAFQSNSVVDARSAAFEELYEPDNLNIAPRFGFAWDPTGSASWSIRGGTGIFFSRVWTNFSGNSRFNPPFSLPVTLSALTPGQNPSAFYRIPFQGDPSFARPLDALGGSTALRPALQTVDRSLQTPYVWQWFFGVQRRLPGDWMVEANYLGNAGRKLLLRNEINRFSGDRADGALDRVNRSFGGIVHGSNAISSIYSGLAVQVQKRFSKGYTAQVAYTFSRSIDADSEPFGGGAGETQGVMEVSNIRLDRGLSAFDATHRLAANFLWELPLLRSAAPVLRSTLGGWQVNGIVSLQSGFPMTVTTSEDYNLDGLFTDRPNAIAAIGGKVADGPHDFLRGAFGDASRQATLFAPAAPGTNGNLGRNTFRGPGFANVDFSVLKNFRMPWFGADESSWEFRAEFFNIFNRVNLREPASLSLGAFNAGTGLWGNPSFGMATSSFEARQVQLALRFRF
ncbi:MAG TPA: TonB-dependent receptor [Bryobacteraceae bacterium]|nr:TonB-dependent receptor [Bryobacteraceae bacterium]